MKIANIKAGEQRTRPALTLTLFVDNGTYHTIKVGLTSTQIHSPDT
jgi:uncharacterized damage-inducible protein DinB